MLWSSKGYLGMCRLGDDALHACAHLGESMLLIVLLQYNLDNIA